MGTLAFVTGRNQRPDSPYSWFVAVTGCAFLSLVCGYIMTTGVLFVLIQDRYGVTKQKASYPVNALSSVHFVLGMCSGPMLHRFKARKTLLLSSTLGVVGSCLSVYTPANDPITWLTICMTIRGVGSSLAFPAVWQVVSTHFKKHLSKALVLVAFAYPLGTLVLPAIIRSSAETYGLESSWLIHGAVYCQALLLALLIKPRQYENSPVQTLQLKTFVRINGNKENSADGKDENMKEGPRSTDVESFGSLLAAIFGEKTFYLLCLSQTVVFGCVIGVRTTVLDYGRDINVDPETNEYIMEVLSFSELIRIPISIIIDARLCYEETIMTVASVVGASSLLLMTLTRGYLYVAVAFIYNICYAVGMASRGTMFAALGRHRLATAYGITSTFAGLFLMTLPFLIGQFRDVHGTYDYLYYVFSLLNLIMALGFGFARVRRWFNHNDI